MGAEQVCTLWMLCLSLVPNAQGPDEADVFPSTSASISLQMPMTVRPEQLRHPSQVISLEWSPGSLEIVVPEQDTNEKTEGVPEVHMNSSPALMTVCADAVIRIWVEVVGLIPASLVGSSSNGGLPTR